MLSSNSFRVFFFARFRFSFFLYFKRLDSRYYYCCCCCCCFCFCCCFFLRYFDRRSLAAFFLTFLKKSQLFSVFLSFPFIYLLRSVHIHTHIWMWSMTGKRIRNHITTAQHTERTAWVRNVRFNVFCPCSSRPTQNVDNNNWKGERTRKRQNGHFGRQRREKNETLADTHTYRWKTDYTLICFVFFYSFFSFFLCAFQAIVWLDLVLPEFKQLQLHALNQIGGQGGYNFDFFFATKKHQFPFPFFITFISLLFTPFAILLTPAQILFGSVIFLVSIFI